MAKNSNAFRTIGEIETTLGVPQHVLRYWGSQIKQIQPVRRGKRAHLYRPEDLQLLAGIKVMVLEKGQTLKVVQQTIDENGEDYLRSLNPVDLAGVTGKSEDNTVQCEPSNNEIANTELGNANSSSKANNANSTDSGCTATFANMESHPESSSVDRQALAESYARLEKLRQRMESSQSRKKGRP